MKRSLLFMGLMVLPTGFAVPAGHATPAIAPIRDCAVAQARQLDFSGAILVEEAGVPTAYARGLTAGPGSAPITTGTRFNLGSAGKMFTAVAVAQLIDSGRVSLDDPIGRFVSGLTAEASKVTVRQLLNHTSGLGNYFAPENLPMLQRAKKLGDLLALVASEKPAFQPGSRFAYSDSGFLLLGLLIERVSGQSYGDYLRNFIFRPAHMTATGLEPADTPAQAVGMTAMPAPPAGPSERAPLPGASTGSASSEGTGLPMGQDPNASQPLRPAPEAALEGGSAGGSYSTVSDVQKFLVALAEARLTSAASLKMLVATQIVVSPAQGAQSERDYGFGFGVGHFNGHRWFGHNGGAPGVNTEVALFPEDGTIVVVLANRDPPVATAMFRQLRSALFDSAVSRTCGRGP